MKYITLAFLLLYSSAASAQKKRKADAHLFTDKSEWFEGSILLTDGNELTGLVKYNTRNGVLFYQDVGEARVFTPNRVSGFEFFDESLQKQRVFYTLTYEDSETNVERPLFFEVLKEYKDFAVLSKADRINVDQRLDYTPTFNTYGNGKTVLEVSQSETVYLMKASGEIKPYFKATLREDGNKGIFTGTDTQIKNKMIDRDLLEEFIPLEAYVKLIQYAKDRNLNFNVKEEFLKILGHYDEMIDE